MERSKQKETEGIARQARGGGRSRSGQDKVSEEKTFLNLRSDRLAHERPEREKREREPRARGRRPRETERGRLIKGGKRGSRPRDKDESVRARRSHDTACHRTGPFGLPFRLRASSPGTVSSALSIGLFSKVLLT